MSTTQEININKLGIIAGGGSLPACLIDTCIKKGVKPFIVGFDGQTDINIVGDNSHLWTGLGSVGKIINFFKENGVSDLVLIGGIKRPAFSDIKPDLRAVKILSKLGVRALGDSNLLNVLKDELEGEGFTLHSINDFCENLLIGEGCIGSYKPNEEDQISIELGLKVSQKIGELDIGQSIIVQNGMVIGVEAVEGTDLLIKRCADLQQKGRGGILVKTCKPQQDKSLDLPTIGVNTVIRAHEAGLCGVVAQSENVIIVDLKNVAKYADKYKIFVIGVSINNG